MSVEAQRPWPAGDRDPFSRHPELRRRIADPLTSYFRHFDPEELQVELRARGLQPEMVDSDEMREASRRETLAGRELDDLWVFAYGSLMWDPALRFVEVRRAYAPEHARRFIFKDVSGWRGTPEAPGVMAALDQGTGCEGLAFRIASDEIDEESRHLWKREKFGPTYTPAFIPVDLGDQQVRALTFLADHGAHSIHPDLPYGEQVRFAATGSGWYGSSFEYVENIARQFEALAIEDPHVTGLLRDASAYRAPLQDTTP
ncbi:gamma-glutamylcyclotransferase [Sulfitobacter sp. LCG007]